MASEKTDELSQSDKNGLPEERPAEVDDSATSPESVRVSPPSPEKSEVRQSVIIGEPKGLRGEGSPDKPVHLAVTHTITTQPEIDLPEPEYLRTRVEKVPLLDTGDANDASTNDLTKKPDRNTTALPDEGNDDSNPLRTVQVSEDGDFSLASIPTLLPSEISKSTSHPAMGYFGEYELLGVLGRGGMGLVYKARQPRLDRIVALKMVIQGQLDSEAEVQRFHSEAEAVAKLDHPGIVPVYEVGEHNGRHYFSMGYVEGKSLATMIANHPLAPRKAAKITAKIAEAIHHAHQRGILHRDLKPSNILVDTAGQPRVIDFGLAKRFEEDANLTATGMVVGTPSYMAPERIDDRIGKVGPESDVYSLGAVLYEMLTGRPPFHAASPVDTMQQVLKSPPVPVKDLNPAVDAQLDAICLHCLRKEPEKRYATAVELSNDLKSWLEFEPVTAALPPSVQPQRKLSSLTVVLFLLSLAGISCSLLFGIRTRSAQKQVVLLQAANQRLQSESQDKSVQLEKLRNQAPKLFQNGSTAFMDSWLLRDPNVSAEHWAKVPGGVEADRLTLQGLLDLKAGRPTEARAQFDKAIETCPGFFPARYFRAYVIGNDPSSSADSHLIAREDLRLVLEASPDDARSLELLKKVSGKD